MSKNKKRFDTSAERRALTGNPFAQLRGKAAELPETPASPPTNTEAHAHAAPFTVARTRKGGWPVRIERRAAGKTVTVVDNVSGDAKALLAALRKRCGAGGAVRENAVELQGDHVAAVNAFLDATHK